MPKPLRSANTKDYAHHGIKLYDDLEEAPNFASVWNSVVQFVESKKAKLNILMCHNGESYDFPVLRKAVERIGKEIPATWIMFDSLPFFRYMVTSTGDRNEKPGLDYLCNLFAVNVANRHRAFDDVQALSLVLKKCVEARSEDIVGYLKEYLESVSLINTSVVKFQFGNKRLMTLNEANNLEVNK